MTDVIPVESCRWCRETRPREHECVIGPLESGDPDQVIDEPETPLENRMTTQNQATPLAYSQEMVQRMCWLIDREISQVREWADRRIAEYEQAKREIQARQGRDPYANAPKWADRTDERIQRITSLPDDGGPDDGERCA